MAVWQSIEWNNTIINWKLDLIDSTVRIWYEIISILQMNEHWYIILYRWLDSNQLSGTIPSSIGNLNSLTKLYVFDMKELQYYKWMNIDILFCIEIWIAINWMEQYHHQLETWLHWNICTYLIWNNFNITREWTLIYYFT